MVYLDQIDCVYPGLYSGCVLRLSQVGEISDGYLSFGNSATIFSFPPTASM